MKNSSDTMWNQTSDLPICSTAPLPLCYPSPQNCVVGLYISSFTETFDMQWAKVEVQSKLEKWKYFISRHSSRLFFVL